MLKYLIIPLADDAVSYCCYEPGRCTGLVSVDLLRDAILWAMKENVSVQFLYPPSGISNDIKAIIDEIEHTDVVPCDIVDIQQLEAADVIVFGNWDEFAKYDYKTGQAYVVRTTMVDLLENELNLKHSFYKADRVNVVITDVDKVNEKMLNDYDIFLHRLIPAIVEEYKSGHQVQLNILTDKLILNEMNNCNAGEESVVLATDGKFYPCPAFFNDGEVSLGDIYEGLNVKNALLYKLSHAPICRICDAYQCKRCIWLNKSMTGEINTPSREQCVMSHIERNASRDLLKFFQEINPDYLSDVEIPTLDYLDPFEKITNQI